MGARETFRAWAATSFTLRPLMGGAVISAVVLSPVAWTDCGCNTRTARKRSNRTDVVEGAATAPDRWLFGPLRLATAALAGSVARSPIEPLAMTGVASRATTLHPSGSGAPVVVVICGTDARYGAEVSEVLTAARAAGAGQVYLAGPEQAVAAATEKADVYLTAKIDAVEALSTLLDRLGA